MEAITVQNLGKKYVINHEFQDDTIRDLVANGVRKLFRKNVNSRQKEEFWALRHIDLSIPEGEVMGIIGRNGAGKSTLLKLLSRITEPTEGSFGIRGRVSSLLEVGTGFSPELTGRENIFLNGAILGMTRHEIKSQFDQIVDFSGVEKFLDTPVKRYSSGMYVRLAFSVAAHLNTDILIVDEVLAVGDAEFQKKCLGKMESVSKGQGRTVLFVSHNMKFINELCNKAILLQNGQLIESGNTTPIIDIYLSSKNNKLSVWENHAENKGNEIVFREVYIHQKHKIVNEKLKSNLPFYILISYELHCDFNNLAIFLRLSNAKGETLFTSWDIDENISAFTNKKKGNYHTRIYMDENLLRPGDYYITVGAHIPNVKVYDVKEDIIKFSMSEIGYKYNLERDSILHPNVSWQLEKI